VNEARNKSGQAYSLTVLTPILAGRESRLARYLNALASGAGSPLAQVPGTHFARWVVVGDVVFEGEGERDHLKLARLLFTSNFDGPVETYLECLRTAMGASTDEIWDNCAGYPGSGDSAAFAAYMRAHQIESSLFFAAYGQQTVDDVKRSLAKRRKLMTFALEHQGASPAKLQSDFDDQFA
jgi:hypothetical protein